MATKGSATEKGAARLYREAQARTLLKATAEHFEIPQDELTMDHILRFLVTPESNRFRDADGEGKPTF